MDNTSDCEWTLVNSTPTSSLGSVDGMVPPPGRNLHFSSSNASDTSDSGGLAGSFDVISPWSSDSPKEGHGEWMGKPCVANHDSPSSSSASSAVMVSPNAATLSSGSNKSFSTSPSSSTPPSPPVRVFGPPVKGLTMRSSIRKSIVPNGQAEKKSVGRRRGPLRPEQRLQAHEIRKMRACLRCRFLKKTCDKNEPCSGCRPSHARLWQVPCTRLDIRDLSYFLKDWTTDYQRHIKLNLSVSNIKGFSPTKWVLQITHGYGHSLAIPAREVFVRDTQGFSVDWIETVNGKPTRFIKRTARLSVGDDGVTAAMIADYLDRHLDQGFEHFVDKHFGGTVFLTEMLKTCYRYYERTGSLVIRKALKLVIAYNLTLHLTLVEAESAKHVSEGKINNPLSKYFGRTAAPVMINFEIKCALAEAWRALQREVLLELSGLYSSVYSGDKLKHWPTIFMIATIVLLVWEEIQFDSHYRRQPGQNVQEFCDEMERTPVGVIVGLFHAISTKVPRFQEWDSEKYHQVLGSNQDVCEVMTEVKGHLEKHNDYLRDRHSASFDAENFECLSNKFLSRLVTRSN
ncbi:hypothetical protein K470DRAFT_216741 [Piedraia hortae CBS 480.64]|uniref:Zn(2)-C6 fungal-type domain-containing protein n=1 Tax=Piedraia hortae CBS 480.64 TaxID=1314780 RepID=A0A6A7BZH8_9PEZI|nr:hypothetical protein K470DRAFT_216741 [Piedraia hortae CBS 480.64]